MTHEQRDRTRRDRTSPSAKLACSVVVTVLAAQSHRGDRADGTNRAVLGEIQNNTRNIAAASCPETVRHLPCTPATELGRLGAFNAGGRFELLRVVTQLLRVLRADTWCHENGTYRV